MPTLDPRTVDELTDAQALRALMVLINHEGLTWAASSRVDAEEALREASADPQLSFLMVGDDAAASRADIARAALAHAAQLDPALEETVARAAEFARRPAQRADAATLGIAAAVVTLFQTEIKVERNDQGRWVFLLHKMPMRESTLGKLIGTLISHFGGLGGK
jgi:hypothetical protein